MPVRQLALAALACLAALAGRDARAQDLAVGSGVVASLTASDPRLDDGTSYDCWVFDSGAGGAFTVRVASHLFDTVVDVGPGSDCTGPIHDGNDDAPDGGDRSHLEFSADGGPWFVRVSSVDPGEEGQYRLSLASGGTPGVGGYGSIMTVNEDEYRYSKALYCSAVDVMVLLNPDAVRTTEQDVVFSQESSRLSQVSLAAGAVLGKREEQVIDEGLALAGTMIDDPGLLGYATAAEARGDCLADLD